jgi:predicted O-linked N-acetylglucosamine transferase (SPINDLY family)
VANPQLELQRARAALSGGEPVTAIRVCQKLLTKDPRNLDARYVYGRSLAALSRWDQAAAEFRRVLATRGDLAAMIDLGIAETFAGNYQNAQAVLHQARSIDARPPQLHFALGLCSLSAGDPAGAVTAFELALARNPRFPDALNNLGVAHDRLGRLEAAIDCFRRASDLHPGHADAQRNLDQVLARRSDEAAVEQVALGADLCTTLELAAELEERGLTDDAIALLRASAARQPHEAALPEALGTLLHRLGQLPEALDCYERALDIDEHRAHTLLNCGRALESMGAPGRALGCFERAMALSPSEPEVLSSIVSLALRICDWDSADTMLARLRRLPHGIDALPPFVLLATDHDSAAVAASLARRHPEVTAAAVPAARPLGSGEPLRVAYLSPDFRAHPVAYAIAGLIERHDRSRVTPVGVALKAGDGSAIETRLRAAFDLYIDASKMSDSDLVTLLLERKIDIAVDLAGLTTGARTGIFARRVARTQVNFLGYPGSMGRSFMDFIIADCAVLPMEDEPNYRERVLRMPHTYLPFDDARTLPPPATRSEAGLPPGFVFCAFNNAYKISRRMFEIWLKLLHDVPGSILWLRSMGAETSSRLRAAASAAGVAAERLVFAAFEPTIEAHLARLQLADLFLDTLPYNAHTTAAEALWAEVPVVTCRGSAFAGRVGASLLTASGLPELICADLDAYQRLATELAREPARLAALRQRLRLSRTSVPLFDTRRYTREFEALLHAAHHTQSGEADSPRR